MCNGVLSTHSSLLLRPPPGLLSASLLLLLPLGVLLSTHTTHFPVNHQFCMADSNSISGLHLLVSLLPTYQLPHSSLQLYRPLPQMYLGRCTSWPLPVQFLLTTMCTHGMSDFHHPLPLDCQLSEDRDMSVLIPTQPSQPGSEPAYRSARVLSRFSQ